MIASGISGSQNHTWLKKSGNDLLCSSNRLEAEISSVIFELKNLQPILRQDGRVTLFVVVLTLFVVSMAYWLWGAYAQVSLEMDLACRNPAAEACVSAKARYMNSFFAAWLSQMFPWILPFVPAFIYVFFFRWLRRNRQP